MANNNEAQTQTTTTAAGTPGTSGERSDRESETFTVTSELTPELREKISQRALELFSSHGGENVDQAMDDWLQAETEVLREAAKSEHPEQES